MDAEAITQQAMAALREGQPDRARELIRDALDAAPYRPDIMHALAVLELQLGEAGLAWQLAVQGEVAVEDQEEGAEALLTQLVLTRAAACEDLFDPVGAEEAYRDVLAREPGNARALQGLAYLLLACGRIDEGRAVLADYVEADAEGEESTRANAAFADAVKRFVADDIHPRELLVAHRGAYVEFFDHHADRMAEQGWIAEAARMRRDEDGKVVPIIPEGARPYAAVRVDLVDPATGQPGLVGDQPMMVALAGYEPLAQAPVVFDWPDHPFPVWVSTQCPWDQLPICIRMVDPMPIAMGAALADVYEALDRVVGDWYQAGFHGEFGAADRGRFHTINDPETPDPASGVVIYTVDMGRAELGGLETLLRRLEMLHALRPVAAVLLGRGFVPGA